MATDPAERFRNIFANTAKPSLPQPGQPHIADLELAKPTPANPEVKPFKIPDVPQVKRKFFQPDRSGARDIISSSEDEDDYVNACKSSTKPKMLEQPKNNGGREPRKPAFENLGDANDRRVELPGHLSDLSQDTHSPVMDYPGDFKTDDMQDLSKLPVHDVDGNKATGHFCIFSLVAKLPYKYMRDPNDQVSKRFFAYNKFYDREWDVYYIQPPERMYAQPIFLLSVTQVQKLLNEISSAFEIDVKLPPAPFTMSFFDDKTPQPMLLGRTKSREDYNELCTTVPTAEEGHGECPKTASNQDRRAFEDFRSKFLDARAVNKKGKTNKQEKKAKEKLVAFREGSSSLRRSQRYFGLRPRPNETVAPEESLSWEYQKWVAEESQGASVVLAPLDITKPAPYPCEKEVVFICFDVEANEHAHHQITEIGVSTLDTKDIMNIPAGPSGKDWIKQIRSRHFRIKEHKHLRNKTFVSGNPDGFKFGESEFVSLRTGEAVSEVDRCFIYPFSGGFQHDGTRGFKLHGHSETVGEADRRIVLLGHDVQTDIDYLSKMGSKIFTSSLGKYPPIAAHPVLSSIEEALDIANLYKVLKKEENTRSLGSIMADLGRDAWDLHNGGNDARYTMECLIGLAIKARLEDDAKIKKEAEENIRLAKEVEAANAAWAARDPIPLPSNSTPAPAICANIDSVGEADAFRAKFLDPAQTPGSAISNLPPGKGRHYGSDNDLDEVSDDDNEWFDHLVNAADEKLKLEGEEDDDSESDFEM